MSRQRWIMYAQQLMPGNVSFRVTVHESIDWCIESLDRFSRDTHTNDVYATLYVYSDEDWQLAREYEGIGCPFDHPDRMIERGPRGGWRVENC